MGLADDAAELPDQPGLGKPFSVWLRQGNGPWCGMKRFSTFAEAKLYAEIWVLPVFRNCSIQLRCPRYTLESHSQPDELIEWKEL